MQYHSHCTNHWWLSTNPLGPFFASWINISGVRPDSNTITSSSVSHIRVVAVQQLRYHVNSCSYLSSPNLAFRSETPPSNRHCKDTFCYLVTDFGKSHLWFRGINTYFVVFKQCNHLFTECDTINKHWCPVFMVSYFQFDGVHVVSGSLDTSIRVWDVESGACRHALMGHQVIYWDFTSWQTCLFMSSLWPHSKYHNFNSELDLWDGVARQHFSVWERGLHCENLGYPHWTMPSDIVRWVNSLGLVCFHSWAIGIVLVWLNKKQFGF